MSPITASSNLMTLHIVDYSDTKLVDEMIIRVATAKMKALR
jgi:hypothetical protein